MNQRNNNGWNISGCSETLKRPPRPDNINDINGNYTKMLSSYICPYTPSHPSVPVHSSQCCLRDVKFFQRSTQSWLFTVDISPMSALLCYGLHFTLTMHWQIHPSTTLSTEDLNPAEYWWESYPLNFHPSKAWWMFIKMEWTTCDGSQPLDAIKKGCNILPAMDDHKASHGCTAAKLKGYSCLQPKWCPRQNLSSLTNSDSRA